MTRETETHIIEGIVYVLPLYEGSPRWVKKIGAFGIGVNWRLSSFNIGVDILKGGILFAVGPLYFWAAHIKKAGQAFEQYHAKEPQS